MRSNWLKILAILFVLGGKTYAQPVDSSLELMVAVVKRELSTSVPNRLDPLALNAKLIWSEKKDQMAVVIKANLLRGWHIYAHVSDKSPFITTKIKLSLPEGITPLEEWEKPNSESYNKEADIYIGEELFFVRYYKVGEGVKFAEELKCGLYYQACDPYKCFPPKTKMADLAI